MINKSDSEFLIKFTFFISILDGVIYFFTLLINFNLISPKSAFLNQCIQTNIQSTQNKFNS